MAPAIPGIRFSKEDKVHHKDTNQKIIFLLRVLRVFVVNLNPPT